MFELNLDENDSQEYEFSKNELNYFAMSPRVVDQFVNQFGALCEEVSLSITSSDLKLKNYLAPDNGN